MPNKKSGLNAVVQISDRNDAHSINSTTSTDSSLGFGDFENGTIYDQVVKLDTPDVDISEEDLWRSASSSQGTKIENLRVQNSTGVVLGNQTFIEGTVIFDRFVTNDTLVERLQQKLSVTEANVSNGVTNGTTVLNQTESSHKKKTSRCKKVILIIVVVISLVIVLGVAAILVYHYYDFNFLNDDRTTETPSTTIPPISSSTVTSPSSTTQTTDLTSSSTETSTESTSPSPSHAFVTRSEWGTSRPLSGLEPISHPVKSIVITETGTNPCTTNETCSKITREEQQKYIKMSWEDIGHSFLPAGYSAIYEGRGWNFSGQHTRPNGGNCFVIAFIGTFTSKQPSQNQIDAYFSLIADGVRQNIIDEQYEMVALCQIEANARPGQALRDLLKTWPHWHQNTTRQC